MFLVMKELMHSKMKFSMITVIFVLIAWLVFILSGLGTGLSTLAASTFKTMKADYVVFEEGSQSSMSKSFSLSSYWPKWSYCQMLEQQHRWEVQWQQR